MFGLVIHWILNAVAFILTAKVVDMIFPLSFRVEDFGTAMVAALVLGLINTFIRPVLKLLTLPINFLTLGLFGLVLNGLLLKLAAGFVPGLHIVGFLPAVLGAVILSVISSILTFFV